MRVAFLAMLIVALAAILFLPISYLTAPTVATVLQNYLLAGFIFVEVLLFLSVRSSRRPRDLRSNFKFYPRKR